MQYIILEAYISAATLKAKAGEKRCVTYGERCFCIYGEEVSLCV